MEDRGEVRLYRLTMALGIPSREILERYAREGIRLRNHMAQVDVALAGRIRGWFDGNRGSGGRGGE